MAKLSLKELEAVLETYIADNKIALTNFENTKGNIVGLLDKVGKIVTLDGNFYDKLAELDGDDLPLGKTVEEYFQDLILPIDYDNDVDGNKALKFYSPTYRPVSYSYSCGKKIIPESIPNNNIERAVNNQGEAVTILSLMTKRLSDSKAMFKYQAKRELLGKIADKVIAMVEDADDDLAEIIEGKTYQALISNVAHYYVAVKSFENTGDDPLTAEELETQGYLVEIKMVKTLAKPTDETTGENFIKAVKSVVEISQDVSEGYSMNGNTIGAESGLSLYVKQGVMPSLEVDTLSGAFHLDKMGMGVTAKVIKDFGSTTSRVYAMIVDPRGVKLHKDYEAVRSQENGFADRQNIFQHMEYTAFASRNTFITIFVEAE